MGQWQVKRGQRRKGESSRLVSFAPLQTRYGIEASPGSVGSGTLPNGSNDGSHDGKEVIEDAPVKRDRIVGPGWDRVR